MGKVFFCCRPLAIGLTQLIQSVWAESHASTTLVQDKNICSCTGMTFCPFRSAVSLMAAWRHQKKHLGFSYFVFFCFFCSWLLLFCFWFLVFGLMVFSLWFLIFGFGFWFLVFCFCLFVLCFVFLFMVMVSCGWF